MDDQALGKMISTAPVILGLSVEANLKPKLAWMKDTLGLDKKASTKLAMSVPSVLILLQDTLDKKLAFLRGEDLNLSDVSAFTAGYKQKSSSTSAETPAPGYIDVLSVQRNFTCCRSSETNRCSTAERQYMEGFVEHGAWRFLRLTRYFYVVLP